MFLEEDFQGVFSGFLMPFTGRWRKSGQIGKFAVFQRLGCVIGLPPMPRSKNLAIGFSQYRLQFRGGNPPFGAQSSQT